MQRRSFLRNSIKLALGTRVALLLSGSFSASALAALKLSAFDETRGRVLAVLARCLFPHADVEDTYYIEVANHIDVIAQNDEGVLKLVNSAIETLNKHGNGDWLGLPVEKKIGVLESLQQTQFMGFMINTTIDVLYRNQEVLELFGYEGSSIEHGGYLHRGFNDIDWLPDGDGNS